MATETATETEKEVVKPSPKLRACIQAVITAVVQSEIALDNYRNMAKSETIRLELTDKKALTAVLFASGDTDARRVSEIVGFVFPKSASAHKELEKAMEQNIKQTDPKKRIAKPVILALQRDDTGKLTLEAALKQFKSAKEERKAGGKTDQTTKRTPKEIEDHLGNLLSAALAFAKKSEYDANDLASLLEEHFPKVYGKGECEVTIDFTPAEEAEEETEKD